jgi:hypothetical protein
MKTVDFRRPKTAENKRFPPKINYFRWHSGYFRRFSATKRNPLKIALTFGGPAENKLFSAAKRRPPKITLKYLFSVAYIVATENKPIFYFF